MGVQLYPAPAGVVVEENTIVNNGNYGMVAYGSGHHIVNNILSSNGNSASNPEMRIDFLATSLTVDSNIWNDPRFVDPAHHNYHLQPGSPAIGRGNPKYTQPVDKDGVSRHLPPDLGAYQYLPPVN